MKKIIAIIQVRLDSTRFPGKSLAKILAKPMIIRVIERVEKSKLINQLIIATSDRKIDDPIAEVVTKYGVCVFRGSANDVLDRYYNAAKKYNAEIIVRITADCPLIDPHVLDYVIQTFLDNDYEYVSNTLEPTYPDGLDVEVFSFEILARLWKEARLPSEREHVTIHIKNNLHKFRVKNVTNDVNLSGLRWTVDYKEDLEFIREIFKKLYKEKSIFLMNDILQLLEENPELQEINAGIERNEGYFISLKKDKLEKK